MRRLTAFAAIVILLTVACSSGSTPAVPTLAPLPTLVSTTPPSADASQVSRHVMLIVLENREYGSVIGNAAAPYVNALASRFGLATQAYATTHPSLPNYISLISGSTYGITDDCTSCSVDGETLADQLSAHGIEWRAYFEQMPSACFKGASSGGYAKKHDPFIYFRNLGADPSLCNRLVPYSQLAVDLQSGSPPSFIWITPDLCHSGHDCSTAQADRWLSDALPPVLASAWFDANAVVFVVWDEGTTNAGCCQRASGGHIPLLVISRQTPAGARLDAPVDLAGLLRTVESLYGLPYLGDASCECSGELTPLLGGAPTPTP